jgi:hypothetical protein
MDAEPGYCARCGADMRGFDAWLTLDGALICITCATEGLSLKVAVPRNPEARDDGR